MPDVNSDLLEGMGSGDDQEPNSNEGVKDEERVGVYVRGGSRNPGPVADPSESGPDDDDEGMVVLLWGRHDAEIVLEDDV